MYWVLLGMPLECGRGVGAGRGVPSEPLPLTDLLCEGVLAETLSEHVQISYVQISFQLLVFKLLLNSTSVTWV